MIEIIRSREADVIAFRAADSGNNAPLGEIGGRIDAEKVYIVSKLWSEPFLLDGLIRAALSAAEGEGAQYYSFQLPEQSLNPQLVRLGFVNNDGFDIFPLGNFFETHKNCGKRC